jgi:hypothetical protein
MLFVAGAFRAIRIVPMVVIYRSGPDRNSSGRYSKNFAPAWVKMSTQPIAHRPWLWTRKGRAGLVRSRR